MRYDTMIKGLSIMKTLIVYDSVHGNTEKLAEAISDTISGEVKLLQAIQANPFEFKSVDLLIIGSPTLAGKPTPAIQALLKEVPAGLNNASAAAFDTRLSTKWVRIFGYAANKMAASLKRSGWKIIFPPNGFFVEGKNGPLKEGELERAMEWAKEINLG